MLTTGCLSWRALAFYFLTFTPGVAQSVAPYVSQEPVTPQVSSTGTLVVSAASDSATLLTFQQGQQTLCQSFSSLLSQDPTTQQLLSWQQQNAVLVVDQQQIALNLGEESAVEPMPTVTVNIPANASTALANYLTSQAALANARAFIHNQLLNALPFDVSGAQISGMQENEGELFEQQNAATVQAQQQAALTLASQSNQILIPSPPPLMIPPGSTPQMQAYLTLRDQLMRAQIQLQNQYVGSTPAASDAAQQNWIQENAAELQQLQTLAQELGQTDSTNQN